MQQTFIQVLLYTGKIWTSKASLEHCLPYSYLQTLLQLMHFLRIHFFLQRLSDWSSYIAAAVPEKKIFFPRIPHCFENLGCILAEADVGGELTQVPKRRAPS